MQRIFRHVIEAVMHPAHIPLEIKAQTAVLGWAAYTWPGGRLLRDNHGAGDFTGDDLIQMAQEIDSFQILAPTMLVGYPLSGLARVIAVQHRGHSINTQPVDMVGAQPMQRRRQHKTMHFITVEVENAGIPVLMIALERMLIFIQRRAVE